MLRRQNDMLRCSRVNRIIQNEGSEMSAVNELRRGRLVSERSGLMIGVVRDMCVWEWTQSQTQRSW